MLMNKIKAFYKIYMINSLSNKVVFVYNLLLPIIYFLANNLRYFFDPIQISNPKLIESVSYFWTYIVMITLLNNVIFAALSDREYGYYKEFFFVTGSKWHILAANFLVQATILLAEITLFNVIFLIVFHTLNWGILVGGILAVLILSVPVTAVSCLFLTLKIKAQTAPIIETITLFALFSLLNFHSENQVINTITLLNPLHYLGQESYYISMGVLANVPSLAVIIQFIAITLVYILIGSWSLAKFTITPIENRS